MLLLKLNKNLVLNSVEHLIALSNKAKFIDMTTIHQLKPITVQMKMVIMLLLNNSTYIINLEKKFIRT